jgi:hypothetical protein
MAEKNFVKLRALWPMENDKSATQFISTINAQGELRRCSSERAFIYM